LFVRWYVLGGQNDQTPGNAGPEANLDTQFGLGMSFPTPGTFYSTGGSPPFVPDAHTPGNSNEPYDDVRGINSFPYSFGGFTDTLFVHVVVTICDVAA
jgi:hypothetical protein